MKRYIIPASLLLLSIGGTAVWYARQSSANGTGYRTEEVKRDELVVNVSATGTLEPEDVVDVGTQVAGMITEFGVGADGKPIDYGSPVEPGTVLARIDDALFKAKVDQSRAQVNSAERKADSARAKLDQAKAKVTEAEANTQLAQANLDQAKAKSVQASKDLARAKVLEPKGSIAPSDLDAYVAANDTNKPALAWPMRKSRWRRPLKRTPRPPSWTPMPP
jgi:HlyD family secretion protein